MTIFRFERSYIIYAPLLHKMDAPYQGIGIFRLCTKDLIFIALPPSPLSVLSSLYVCSTMAPPACCLPLASSFAALRLAGELRRVARDERNVVGADAAIASGRARRQANVAAARSAVLEKAAADGVCRWW